MHDDNIDAKIVILGETCQFPLFFCPGPPTHSRFSLFPQMWGKPVCCGDIPRTDSIRRARQSLLERHFSQRRCPSMD